jgi:hypothetical protein
LAVRILQPTYVQGECLGKLDSGGKYPDGGLDFPISDPKQPATIRTTSPVENDLDHTDAGRYYGQPQDKSAPPAESATANNRNLADYNR